MLIIWGRVPFFFLFLVVASSGASAETAALDFLARGTPLIDLRGRYEGVDDKAKPLNAHAYTMRARVGYQTAPWRGVSFLGELDQLWDLGGTFNNTRNGKVVYPTVADPEMTALNRLQLTFASDFETTFVLGRQRILFGDQRFVGNAGWRQHEQTYDAFTVTNVSIPDLTLSYSYVDRVNRVYGPASPHPSSAPAGAFHCDCHLIDGVYTGIPFLKLEMFALMLDLDQRHGPRASMLSASKLSTATLGLKGEYKIALSDQVSLGLLGAYAHQSNYRNNPVSVDINYWRGEGSVGYAGLTAIAGYEAMAGNGTVGFSTPLATTHAFDGWADMFLTTPSNGLDNLYLKGAYAAKDVANLLSVEMVTATVTYRDFSTDRTRIGIGTEWDGALEFAIDMRASMLLQYANYQGSGIGFGGFPDRSIAWVQLAYKY